LKKGELRIFIFKKFRNKKNKKNLADFCGGKNFLKLKKNLQKKKFSVKIK